LPYASSSTDYFHEFVNPYGLVDLRFTMNPFTWSNHRDGHNLIHQRLDRGMASPQWVYLFLSFSILHLPASGSDHDPLLLDTAQSGHLNLRNFGLIIQTATPLLLLLGLQIVLVSRDLF